MSGVPAEQLGAMLLGLYPLAAEPERLGTGALLDWLARHIAFDGAWFGRSLFEAGTLRPFPITADHVYPLDRAHDAYRTVLAGARERVLIRP